MSHPDIDPAQNPMRPSYFMNYAKDETPAEMVLRKLACWLGVGGYNAPTVDANLFHRKIVEGVQMLLQSAAKPAAQEAIAGAQPQPQTGDRDAYEGCREDLLDWKRRALKAEAALRDEQETTSNLVRALREEVQGSTFMGEPVLPKREAQPAQEARAEPITPRDRTESVYEEERIEAAFWRFDARRKGYGQWKDSPMSERDAFKAEIRNALGSEKIRAEMRLVARGWRRASPQEKQEARAEPLTEAQIDAARELAMSDGAITASLEEVGAAWLMDEGDEMCQAKAIRHAVATAVRAAKPAADIVGYVSRWGGKCRDCADENGVCPNSGLPCGGAQKAIEHVIKALQYGVQHGFIVSPLAAAPSAQRATPPNQPPVAQRLEPNPQSAHEADQAEAAPQERQVSNLRQPAASPTAAARVLASSPGDHTAAQEARAEPLPMPGSPEASAMMDSLLSEYGWPANPKNAARAGYEAARRLLAASPQEKAR